MFIWLAIGDEKEGGNVHVAYMLCWYVGVVKGAVLTITRTYFHLEVIVSLLTSAMPFTSCLF